MGDGPGFRSFRAEATGEPERRSGRAVQVRGLRFFRRRRGVGRGGSGEARSIRGREAADRAGDRCVFRAVCARMAACRRNCKASDRIAARFQCRPPSGRPSRGGRGPPGAVPRREALRLRFGTAEPAIPPPPTFCRALPLRFRIAAEGALEAKTAPEGRLEVFGFPDEIWSGRRDSNPRPQPWQGCALPLSYARFRSIARGLHKDPPKRMQAKLRRVSTQSRNVPSLPQVEMSLVAVEARAR